MTTLIGILGVLVGVWLTVAAVLAVILHEIPGASGGSWLYSIGAALFWPCALALAIYNWAKEKYIQTKEWFHNLQ